MQPQTPKSSEKKNTGVTPSLTFGSLASSPSNFRFLSPRNMNFLSSLTPQRLFQRYCRTSGENDEKETTEIEHTTLSSLEMGSAVLESAILSPFDGSRASQNFPNESTVDSVHTADSADIWSFAGEDSHAVGANLTAITENATEKDLFFSPRDLFLEHSPLDSEVSVGTSTATARDSQVKSIPTKDECRTPSSKSHKRSFSSVDETPCSKLASEIDRCHPSPPREPRVPADVDVRAQKKVWTAILDDELLRCFAKLTAFRACHDTNDAIFKGTSQNKILSRMLAQKTRVSRTQKQVSGRMLRLTRTSVPRASSQPSAESSPIPQKFSDKREGRVSPVIEPDTPKPPVSTQISKVARKPALIRSFDALNMSFRYKDANHSNHVFASLENKTAKRHNGLSVAEAKKQLPGKNTRFLADFDALADTLKAQGVDIHNVFCTLNLTPEVSAASTPISPTTNPRQLSLENGSFSSHLKLTLDGRAYTESLISLKSHTAVYKNTDQLLFRKEESVNGYRGDGEHFNLEAPFLGQFWAGFLTFIVNGTSDFADLENLVIMQTISDSASSDKILGFFVYSFTPTQTRAGEAKIAVMRLAESAALSVSEGEIDELETILASSPLRSSPSRADLQIRVDLARKCHTSGPSTAPTFNSDVLHQNNVNFGFSHIPQQRPGMVSSKSTPHFNFANMHASGMTVQQNHALNTGIRHHSAGQMGSFMQSQGHFHTQTLSSPALGASCFPEKPMTGPPAGQFQVQGQARQGQFPVQTPGQFSNNFSNQIPNGMHASGSIQAQQMSMISGQLSFPQNAQPMPYQMPYQQPYVNGPTATAFAPRAKRNVSRAPYPITTNHHFPQEINSAPASQVRFFPKKSPRGSVYGSQFKIQSMIQYDPDKSKTAEQKVKSRKTNFHTFPATQKIEFHSENSGG